MWHKKIDWDWQPITQKGAGGLPLTLGGWKFPFWANGFILKGGLLKCLFHFITKRCDRRGEIEFGDLLGNINLWAIVSNTKFTAIFLTNLIFYKILWNWITSFYMWLISMVSEPKKVFAFVLMFLNKHLLIFPETQNILLRRDAGKFWPHSIYNQSFQTRWE